MDNEIPISHTQLGGMLHPKYLASYAQRGGIEGRQLTWEALGQAYAVWCSRYGVARKHTEAWGPLFLGAWDGPFPRHTSPRAAEQGSGDL
jgi:hypothetical protein